MTDTRICLFCEFFRADPGFGGTSVTPGHNTEIYCAKEYWFIQLYYDMAEDYRRKLLTAKNCPDWKPCEMIRENKL